MVLLVGVLTISMFYLVHDNIESDIITRIDHNLIQTQNNLQRVFELGFQLPLEGYSVDFREVPAQVLRIAESAVPLLKITRWKPIEKGSSLVYEFKGLSGNSLYEVEVDSRGNLVELEKSLSEDIFYLLKGEFKNKYGDRPQYWMRIQENHEGKLPLRGPRDLDAPHSTSSFEPYTHIMENGHEARILNGTLGAKHSLQLGCYLYQEEGFMQSYRKAFFNMLFPSIILSLGLGWLVSRGIIKELQIIELGIERMGSGELHQPIKGLFSIKEFQLMADKFNQMAIRLKSAMDEMQSLTDQVAHDLRTPITRIRTQIEVSMTKAGNIDPGYVDLLDSCHHLEALINTLLEISKLQSGIQDLDKIPIDLGEMTSKAVVLFGPMAEEKKLTLTVELSPSTILVMAQPKMLQRALANLLDNAIKYTAHGSVKLRLFALDDRAVLEVSDTGIGIEAEHIAHIFKRFYRSPESRIIQGHGLGLSYVQSVVQAHGGQIEVESIPCKGSTFRIHFPLASGSVDQR